MTDTFRKLKQSCLAILVSQACVSASASAQSSQAPAQSKAPTALVVEVLAFRSEYVEGTTPIEACSVVRQMATPEDFPQKFPQSLNKHFDRLDRDPCAPLPKTPNANQGVRKFARLDGFDIQDTSVTALMTVINGENYHREAYRGHKSDSGPWYIFEMRIFAVKRVDYH